MTTTAFFTTWWQARPDAKGNAAQAMWESWLAPHRMMILLALYCLAPIRSLYEIGCGAGPNLRLIKDKVPSIQLGGCDASQAYALFASEHLGLSIDHCILPNAPEHHGAEVVLSCYTLAYLDPTDCRMTLEQIRQSEVRAIILVEPMGTGALVSHGAGSLPAWHHDYRTLCEETGWTMTWRWPIVPPVDGLNTLLIVE